MSAPSENAQHNAPINHTAIKAIRHLLNALDALQKVETATDAACIIGRFLSDGIGVEIARLWERGDE
ncbi:MAG: hypothetical protein GJU72_06575 [Acidithiobacillus ferriphilus]|jgi:hypothetical protein|uniref:hypothetical protein n=1 Tax=Acidithiobacillus ferriphilus TaxID=1689834 RepID=UPI002431707E|nr:hypothetical protein [Acidithiobacillus ferriphilus]MBW9248729.1 hypothetical protein [Acidithiobacillus ferriphilus]MBW9255653.1 hypothetical protein [Acidithiobacillus ferriphilus]